MGEFSKAIRRFLPLVGAALFALAVWALHRELASMSLAELRGAFARIPFSGVFLALLAVVVNYALLTLNEKIAVADGGGNIPYPKVAVVSFVSNGIGFNVGMSAISGGSVRYRLYSSLGLGPLQIARVIALAQVPLLFGPFLANAAVFLFAPDLLFVRFHWARSLRPLFALLCAAIPLAALLAGFAAKAGRTFRVRGFSLSVPYPKVLLSQFAIGVLDSFTASLVLYALLPGRGVGPAVFYAAFALSALLGMLSQVPGGLGVFDAALMMVLSPFYSGAEVLGAVLLYRFLYYVIPLICATVLLSAIELNERMSRYIGAVTNFLPHAAAAWTFVTGAWLLFSTATPLLARHLEDLRYFIPLQLFEASHFVKSLVGSLLLFLSWGLAKRLASAWSVTIAALVLALFLSLTSGLHWVQASFIVLLLFVLFFSRGKFYRLSFLSNPDWKWTIAIAAVIGAVIWWGFFSFRHVEYSNELWWTFTFRAGAPRFLRAAAGMSCAAVLGFLFLWLRPAAAQHPRPSAETVKRLVALSAESDAALALLGDKEFFLAADETSAVMYAPSGRFWISMGDPIGEAQNIGELIWRFCEEADRKGASAAFYETGETWLGVYRDAGMHVVPIGDDARVNVSEVTEDLAGPQWKKMRGLRQHIAGEGVVFRVLEDGERDAVLPALRKISDEWLETVHGVEKGFSLGFFDEAYLKNFPVAVAEKEGAAVAFCNLWLGGGEEFSVDLMRYGKNAPRDAMTWLFLESMLWGKARGYRYFRMGMAPLSNMNPASSLWERAGEFIFEHGERFYNFKGLRFYKEKFQPEWQRRYIVYRDAHTLPLLLSQLVLLISRKRAEKK